MAENIVKMLSIAIPVELSILKLQEKIKLPNKNSVMIVDNNDGKSIVFELHSTYESTVIHWNKNSDNIKCQYTYIIIYGFSGDRRWFHKIEIKKCKNANTFSLMKIRKAYNAMEQERKKNTSTYKS